MAGAESSRPPPRTRSDVKSRVYSSEEVGEFRAEWERDRREDDFGKALARLEGQYNGLPALIEATSRRIFQELFAAAATQAAATSSANTQWRWRRADSMIAFGQLALAGAVLYLAIHK